MFKPKIPVHSQDDISDKTIAEQNPKEIIDVITSIFPSAKWDEYKEGWGTTIEDEYTWYEIGISIKEPLCWSIRTSHYTDRRPLISEICKKLDVIAFDGQAMVIISKEGEIPAINK